jgi:hypothetical protein
MRRLLFLLPLCLTGCANVRAHLPLFFPSPPAPVVTSPRPVKPTFYRTRDGLKITPVETPLDENSRILGIEKWRFTVSVPPLTNMLVKRIEFRYPGRAPVVLSDSSASVEANAQDIPVLVAIQAANDFRSDDLLLVVDSAGSTGRSRFDFSEIRPAISLEKLRSHSRLQEFQKDGSWLLREYGNRTPYPNNPKIVMILRVEK